MNINHKIILKKAVFLDRDGTIIEDGGYLSNPSQVTFFNDTFDALKRLQKDYMLFMVTNQQGISEGILTAEEVDRVNQYVVDSLNDAGINIMHVYVCPHTKADNCECRKPKPYFLHKASKDYSIELKNSFVIGDHPSDIQFANNANAKGIYLLTGHGERHLSELNNNEIVASNISNAVNRILGLMD